MIKKEDAERRGRVYDELISSFLFTITNEYDVDSTRLGNKLRYINHSSNGNCIPAVMRVDGDAIIGIYAKKDIQAFEELLFDYGYNPSAPSNSKNPKKSKKRRPNPVDKKSVSANSSKNPRKTRHHSHDGDSEMEGDGADSHYADFFPSRT